MSDPSQKQPNTPSTATDKALASAGQGKRRAAIAKVNNTGACSTKAAYELRPQRAESRPLDAHLRCVSPTSHTRSRHYQARLDAVQRERPPAPATAERDEPLSGLDPFALD